MPAVRRPDPIVARRLSASARSAASHNPAPPFHYAGRARRGPALWSTSAVLGCVRFSRCRLPVLYNSPVAAATGGCRKGLAHGQFDLCAVRKTEQSQGQNAPLFRRALQIDREVEEPASMAMASSSARTAATSRAVQCAFPRAGNMLRGWNSHASPKVR